MRKRLKLAILMLSLLIACNSAPKEETGLKVKQAISENTEDVIFGIPESKNIVFMYGNYQCPYCRLFFSETLPKIQEKYIENGKLKLVIKFLDFNGNPNTLRAMQAASCISRFGYYSKFHPLLLVNPDVVFSEEFDQLLDDIMENNEEIAECILNNNDYYYLRSNLAEFRMNFFTGTPTFVMNQNAYRGYRSFDEFETILKKEFNF